MAAFLSPLLDGIEDDQLAERTDEVFGDLFDLGLAPDAWEGPWAKALLDACIDLLTEDDGAGFYCPDRVDQVLTRVGRELSPVTPGCPPDANNPEGFTPPLF